MIVLLYINLILLLKENTEFINTAENTCDFSHEMNRQYLFEFCVNM